jgi:hypothetical protein
LRRIKLDNATIFHKLAALRISVVPHERTNATTEASVDALYTCRLIAAAFLFVALCFSRIEMPKASYRLKGRIVTISAYEERLAQQKIGEKRRKTSITSTPSEEIGFIMPQLTSKKNQILWTDDLLLNISRMKLAVVSATLLCNCFQRWRTSTVNNLQIE